jgi:type IV pilus assembly protein PilN
MRNIEASPWMGHADLGKIENKAGTNGVDKKMPQVFSLDVKLRKPEEAQGAEAADEVADTAKPSAAARASNEVGGAAAPAAPAAAATPATTPATGEKK